MPLHPRRHRFRGFNQSKILAQEIGKYWQSPVQEILKRHRYTPPQVELSRNNRLKNVRGAFSLIYGTRINPQATYFLIDDVCTTGTTLRECARVLKHHGAQKVWGFVIARAL
ncbi:MAG: phosphoribosyltransferase family protein [Patescibacteria group bacterium]